MFNTTSNGMYMPVAPACDGYGRNNDGMFGGDFAWIILLALLFGWGGNGFGGFGGRTEACATQADVRAAVDQQTLISKLDQQTYGLADSTYALNNTITNGFHGVDNAICTLGYQTQAGFNGLSNQLASCCCDIERQVERGFCDTNYNMATQACETRQAIADSTRSILDFLTQDKISTLQAENQELRLKASQAAQNTYLVNELRPCPVPAYITCSPYAASYGLYGNNSCGCGCGSY